MTVASSGPPRVAPEADAEPAEGNYFVATYPPFSAWRAELVPRVQEALSRPRAAAARGGFGIYVHVPFCARRCGYCYYLSYGGMSGRDMEAYVDGVIEELELYRSARALTGRRPGFVYFGGGTPSLLPPEAMHRLIAGVQSSFPWDEVEEATFECAPRSVTPGKMVLLREAGINRVSLGVQQLDDGVLGMNGRVHLTADVDRAYEAVRAASFDEVNLDLIVGLIGETDASFRSSLEGVIRMGPDSVTLYPLEIPHNTPLFRSLRDGDAGPRPASWEVKRARLAWAFERLEAAGYALRSAYAAALGRRHRRFVFQEEQYRGADLLGLGVSSFSFVAGVHYQNHSALEPYLASVRSDRLPISRAYVLADPERLVREFILQLKLGRVDRESFRRKFGVDVAERFAEPLRGFAAREWLVCDPHEVRLTREGLVRADRLLPAFYLPEHRGLGYW
ncbi:MAG: coproporphyrinogen III oxidase family protein [Planctomycetes bacterium]|nr:coproporphyrinogen III oxidase family protein [Planctomycetota bacterium]